MHPVPPPTARGTRAGERGSEMPKSTPEHLTRKKCRECGKSILVAEYSPHPLEHKATGMSANNWDDDREYFVGWICNDCAFEKAMTVGGGGMVGGCGASMSFSYMPL